MNVYSLINVAVCLFVAYGVIRLERRIRIENKVAELARAEEEEDELDAAEQAEKATAGAMVAAVAIDAEPAPVGATLH